MYALRTPSDFLVLFALLPMKAAPMVVPTRLRATSPRCGTRCWDPGVAFWSTYDPGSGVLCSVFGNALDVTWTMLRAITPFLVAT